MANWFKLVICSLALVVSSALALDQGRLPKSIVPEHYRIELLALLEQKDPQLIGNLRFDFLVKEATDVVVLNGVNLTIGDEISLLPLTKSAILCSSDGRKTVEPTGDHQLNTKPAPKKGRSKCHISYDDARQLIVIQLPWTLARNTRYQMAFNYRGQLSDSLDGLYRSRYADERTGKEG